MKICQKCGAENADTAKFCNECGNVFEENNDSSTIVESNPETASTDSGPAPAPGSLTTPVPESEPEKKKKRKPLIALIAVIIAICLVVIFSTRRRIKSLEVTYIGSQAEGVVLDSDNQGFKVIAIYSDGDKEIVPAGEWHIDKPQTLEADITSDITISYKNVKEKVSVECATTRMRYITAKYNGSTYEGTIINGKSDIKVVGTYGNGSTVEISSWNLSPKEVVLEKGITSKIDLTVKFTDGTTMSDTISVTGIEDTLNSLGVTYNGSTQAGTVVNDKSDFTVVGTYASGKKQTFDNWELSPKNVTLEEDVESELEVSVIYDNEKTFSEVIKIKGTEKLCETREYYEKASSLTVQDLTKKPKIFGNGYDYCYNNDEHMPLIPDDVAWIESPLNKSGTVEDGAVYRKIAYVLTGIEIGANYKYFAKYMLGFTPDTREDFDKYIPNLKTFIIENSSNVVLEGVMKKLESLDSVSGEFNYKYNNSGELDAAATGFDFTISNVTECAEEMQISEEMLGYILSMLNEFGTETTFDKNSCKCVLKSY